MYADIQKRELTKNYSQYSYFRKENESIFEYLKKFPKLPKDVNLNFIQDWEFPNFHLSKISYYTEPEVKVFAYLLLPNEQNDKKPGILALHQHNDEYKAGKSEVIGLVKNPRYTKLEAVLPKPDHETPASRQQFAYAQELCEKGFVVLAPDFLSFEEYRDLDEYFEEPGFIRGYEELISAKYLLYGSCLLAKHLHDAYVAVSVLLKIKEVDTNNLGVIGHSLGGEIGSILTAFDRRIKAGVSSCGTICYVDFEAKNRMETAETIIPGFRADQKDFDFFLDMIPPTAFMATNGLTDITVQGKNLLDKPRENFQVIKFRGGHEFPKRIREKAYTFLEETLMNR